MRTTHKNGDPYDQQSLLDALALRLTVLNDLASMLCGGGNDPRLSIISNEISFVLDDWDCFEQAMIALEEARDQGKDLSVVRGGAR